MLTDILAGEWPTDRLAPCAEIIYSRYLRNHQEVDQWKADLERWLSREAVGCGDEVKDRIGARRV